MKKRRRKRSGPKPIHYRGCNCSICDAIAAGVQPDVAIAQARDWEFRQLAKHGWYVHLIANDDSSPTGFQAHTHGLREAADHADFQVVVPLPQNLVHDILINLVDRVKTGERFEVKSQADNVIGNALRVAFLAVKEDGRDVLRVILPDGKGKLGREEIAYPWSDQYLDGDGEPL